MSDFEKTSVEDNSAPESAKDVRAIDHISDLKELDSDAKVIHVHNTAFAAATQKAKLRVWSMEVRVFDAWLLL